VTADNNAFIIDPVTGEIINPDDMPVTDQPVAAAEIIDPDDDMSVTEAPVAAADSIEERLDHLSARVDELAEIVETLVAAPVDAGHTRAFWAWLVETTIRYYLVADLDMIRRNRALVEEWYALYVAARHAFGPKAGSWDRVQWHDALERVLVRSTAWKKREQADGVDSPDLPPWARQYVEEQDETH
jgi:hypothetical protein